MSEVSKEDAQMLELLRKYQPTVVVTIPLPPRALTAQQGVHRMVKSAAVKEYRSEVHLVTLMAKLAPIKGKVQITHVWWCGLTHLERACRKNKVVMKKKDAIYRPDDEQNATYALKAAIDGLVDAKLLRGDTRHDVKWGDFVKLATEKEHFGKNGILLFIREINE